MPRQESLGCTLVRGLVTCLHVIHRHHLIVHLLLLLLVQSSFHVVRHVEHRGENYSQLMGIKKRNHLGQHMLMFRKFDPFQRWCLIIGKPIKKVSQNNNILEQKSRIKSLTYLSYHSIYHKILFLLTFTLRIS